MIGIAIDAEPSLQPKAPWRADSESPLAAAQPPPVKATEPTVFGLAGELKNLVRDDRKYRSDQARRLKRAKNSP